MTSPAFPPRRSIEYQFPQDEPGDGKLAAPRVSFALQGGASLGAYTWGVLDAILEDGRLDIDGVTGASAGAINAAALGVGWTMGGRQGARDRLRAFWEGLAKAADERRRPRFDLARTLLSMLPKIRTSEAFYSLTSRLVTDFYMDADTMEPLRSTLSSALDFTQLTRADSLKVFVNVTDVQSGQPEVFVGADIDVDAICASCAVPFLFRPLEVRGRFYWDGGLLGNPAIYPVIYGCDAKDIVLVETTSTGAVEVPKTAAQVLARTMELAASAGLVRELRTIKFVTHLLRDAPRPGMREVRLHRIPAHPDLVKAEGGRGFRVDVPFFHVLRDLGRETGQQWLATALAQ